VWTSGTPIPGGAHVAKFEPNMAKFSISLMKGLSALLPPPFGGAMSGASDVASFLLSIDTPQPNQAVEILTAIERLLNQHDIRKEVAAVGHLSSWLQKKGKALADAGLGAMTEDGARTIWNELDGQLNQHTNSINALINLFTGEDAMLLHTIVLGYHLMQLLRKLKLQMTVYRISYAISHQHMHEADSLKGQLLGEIADFIRFMPEETKFQGWYDKVVAYRKSQVGPLKRWQRQRATGIGGEVSYYTVDNGHHWVDSAPGLGSKIEWNENADMPREQVTQLRDNSLDDLVESLKQEFQDETMQAAAWEPIAEEWRVRMAKIQNMSLTYLD
jgi:hypothetical protein